MWLINSLVPLFWGWGGVKTHQKVYRENGEQSVILQIKREEKQQSVDRMYYRVDQQNYVGPYILSIHNLSRPWFSRMHCFGDASATPHFDDRGAVIM